jgi:hypothetical protein
MILVEIMVRSIVSESLNCSSFFPHWRMMECGNFYAFMDCRLGGVEDVREENFQVFLVSDEVSDRIALDNQRRLILNFDKNQEITCRTV